MTCDRLSSGWLGGLGALVGLAGYGGLVGCARSGTRTGIIIIITFISGVKCQLALLILELKCAMRDAVPIWIHLEYADYIDL